MQNLASYTLSGKPKVIALVGPTASGKSALGIWLAQKIKGEIISADSRQVYKGLNLGTGKVTKKEMAGVPHHLIDVLSPKKQFSVDDFVRLASMASGGILKKGKVPIIAGGTGLYIDTFLGRMSYPSIPPDPRLRKKLGQKTAPELFAMLVKKDPTRAQNIDNNNPRRLIRALEVAKALGKSPSKEEVMDIPDGKYDVLWLGLSIAPQILKKKIRARLRARIKAGMVAEAGSLLKQGVSYKRMEELGLEYRYLARLLQDKITKEEFVSQLERAINDYAKRQNRWFKRNQDIIWISSKSEALRLAKAFLGGHK